MLRRRPLPSVSRKIAFLFGAALALATLPLVIPLLPFEAGLREGDIAASTLEARHDAQYPSDSLTRRARDEAAADVPEVLLPADPSVLQQQSDRMLRFLDQVRTIRQQSGRTSQQQLVEISNLPGASALSASGRTSLVTLERGTFDAFVDRANRALSDILYSGVREDGVEAAIQSYLDSPVNASATVAESGALRELLRAFVTHNVHVDEAATQRAREDARANVSPVVQTYTRGQVVVSEGQELDAERLEALRKTGVLEDGIDVYDVLAGAAFAIGFGTLLGVYVVQYQPFSSPAGRRLALTGIAIVAVLAAVRFILPEVTPDRDQHYLPFIVPVAAAAMITASFADLPFAAVVAVCVGLFASFIAVTAPELAGAGFIGPLESLELAIAYTVGGLAGAVSVYRAEHLTRYAFSALAVFFATGVVLASFWALSEDRSNEALGWLSLAAALNGVASAVVTTGVFVVLSMALGVTTRLQLMELVRADHPLLHRLQEEAPGTYHHSMMVAALAERAAMRIGADALVVRAGAYYHDIGKLARPGHFIENMLDGRPSPHDTLTPTESAAIIRNHVLGGSDFARRHRLPPLVRDFIPQHHGTRLVTYFYRRASQEGQQPDPAAFRYPGPRPQSKETAIVMLADSCEALVRAGSDRSQAKIDQLVDGVLAERLAEGQLDECDITMRELHQVAASFKATLRAVYHPRIEYPSATPDEVAILSRLAEEGVPSGPTIESA